MKTTLDLPDDLLAEAKATAARRRTTLKAVVEHALRHEILFDGGAGAQRAGYETCIATSAYGIPCYRRPGADTVSSDDVYRLLEEEGG